VEQAALLLALLAGGRQRFRAAVRVLVEGALEVQGEVEAEVHEGRREADRHRPPPRLEATGDEGRAPPAEPRTST
jgi:hypothetical protein